MQIQPIFGYFGAILDYISHVAPFLHFLDPPLSKCQTPSCLVHQQIWTDLNKFLTSEKVVLAEDFAQVGALTVH